MRAFISTSFSQRAKREKEIAAVKEVLIRSGVSSWVFVDEYIFGPTAEKQMMQQAMADINQCDILIADAAEKAIGIGVEAGYAKAKGKTVVYLRPREAEHSATVSGISDFQIIYMDLTDLETQLAGILEKIKQQ
jgi:2'-deoxynucleoside 5'-phosphate N-hydrolase